MWARSDQRVFVILVGALISLAWLTIWVWGHSPYARYLSHGELGQVSLNGGLLLLGVVFVIGWVIMLIAMMLPTSLPLVMLFRNVISERPNRTWLVVSLILGYLGAWTAFGIAAYIGDWGLHRLVSQVNWLEVNAWMIGVSTLVLAGIYQFTPLKYICLTKCRTPRSFIIEHWHGGNERLEALQLGIHHGMFCIGCCWTLMLLMFALGLGNIGWMLILGAIMAAEKNMAWGRKLSAPLGATLVSSGVVLGLLNLAFL